ncbi:MAG: hypothetical protein IJW07_03565, partial [Lentisphaeria bacterium]|nr:hypothetical protein [Lentisphaeria bacterium]
MKKTLILTAMLFFCVFCRAEEAADPLRSAAEQGDSTAQYKLGNEYFYGTETRKVNYELAAY